MSRSKYESPFYAAALFLTAMGYLACISVKTSNTKPISTEQPENISEVSDELISLECEGNSLELLVMYKGEQMSTTFGYLHRGYHDGSDFKSNISQSATYDNDCDQSFLFDWRFDDVLTGESVNLNTMESTAGVRFFVTEANNCFSLQSIIDNQVSRTELQSFVESALDFSLEDSDEMRISTDYGDVLANEFQTDEWISLTDEWISLGDSNHPLKFLVITEGTKAQTAACGYFRWDYKNASDSKDDSLGFTSYDFESGTFFDGCDAQRFDLLFDDVLTGKIINLSELDCNRGYYFWYANAEEYLSSQQKDTNHRASRSALEHFIDDCQNYSIEYLGLETYFRCHPINIIAVDSAYAEEDLHSVMDDKPLVKIRK